MFDNTLLTFRLLKRKNKFFFSSANMLSMIGVIVGVFSLLTVTAVMEGLESKMIGEVVGTKAEIKIHQKDYHPIKNHNVLLNSLEREFPHNSFAPVCSGELMLKHNNHIFISNVNGIDLEKQSKISSVFDNIVVGEPTPENLEDGIILGLELSMDLHATVGEFIQVTFPIGTIPTSFGLMPRTMKLKVVGIFRADIPEFSSFTSFISLKNGQSFYQTKNGIQRIDVKTMDAFDATAQTRLIQAFLKDGFVVESWESFEKNLFTAIDIEQKIVSFALFLMVLISAMNLMGNMVKLIAEKRKELGVLKAIGASDKFISTLFLKIGFIIGIIGSFIGAFLALILLNIQMKYNIVKLPIETVDSVSLPIQIKYSIFIITIIVTIIILLLSSWIPSKRTLTILPIKIIRNR
ncbi:MAG: FtsX-like permease family protein [Candidatus Cloacimonadota bacterium]|nr:FtsX-like permease family protein [Candidatus Cloacimonadota bacterium]